ncbi:MAG: sialate O-acetylesterase [Pedobacter sp.]|nr:MAG: sialate O-acetylesterase [Pedobacter sp.]
MIRLKQVIIILLLCATAAQAEVKLPKLVGNGMVLQRDQKINIWGWANVNEEVSLTFMNKTYRTKANADKQWAIVLEPQKAGGPYTMRINNLELHDLLIGDVWLCSGQSNMEALMSRANIKENYAEVIKKSNYPMIRQFTVKRGMAFNPVPDVASDEGWVSTTPQTVLNFSAVAFFFARDLYERYQVPIGIINSTVGGTPVQSWVNSESLKNFPAYDSVAQRLKDTAEVSRILTAHKIKSTAWYKSIQENDLGSNEKWFSTAYSQNTGWDKIEDLTQFSKKVGKAPYGTVWFKTVVDVPQHLAGKGAIISLGSMQTEDETYVNGQKVGSTNSGYTDRNYTIAPGLLKAGQNTVTMRMISPTTGIAFNPKNVYQLIFPSESISLANPWTFKAGIEKEMLPKGDGLSLHSPTAYYYAMIKPLAKYPVKGVLWYQGESNVPRPGEYEFLLTALIKRWRTDWAQPDLPFLYVQLANYLSTPDEPELSNWALLREAQMRTLKVPNTAMAVIHDVGERKDLHPKNKLDVGKRLALAARKLAYHEDIVFSGPIYKSFKVNDNQIYISFDQIGTGLQCIGDKLNTFTISADGKLFVPAQAKIVGSQVVVWNDTITKPVAVRYAWADSPDGANLYNKEGLPASSFKTN